MTTQLSLALAKRDRKIAVARSNADEQWYFTGLGYVEHIHGLGQHVEITSDDVWDHLTTMGLDTSNHKAMGPLMREAAKLGYIEATGRYRKSVRASCNARPLLIWKVRGR